jgi:hypothetical protein
VGGGGEFLANYLPCAGREIPEQTRLSNAPLAIFGTLLGFGAAFSDHAYIPADKCPPCSVVDDISVFSYHHFLRDELGALA